MLRKDRQLLVLHEYLDELKTSERNERRPPRTVRRTRWRGVKDCPKRQVGKSFWPGSLCCQMCTVLSFDDYMMPFGSPRCGQAFVSSWAGSDEGTEQSQSGQGSLAHLQLMLEYEFCISPSCRLQILHIRYVGVERRAFSIR
jgi:hypothetical protein